MAVLDPAGYSVTYVTLGYAKEATRVEPPSFEALDATSANLAVEGASDSSSAFSIGIGNDSRTSGSTGAQTVIHGLGRVPKWIQVTSSASAGSNLRKCQAQYLPATGVAKGTSMFVDGSGRGVDTFTSSIGLVVNLGDSGGTDAQASVTATDANTFTLNWASIGVDVEFQWTVLG